MLPKEEENPWDIKSIYDLQYFLCPSCAFKDGSKQDFISHAFFTHPESVNFLKNIADESLNDVLCPWDSSHYKTEEYDENIMENLKEELDIDNDINIDMNNDDDNDKHQLDLEYESHQENINPFLVIKSPDDISDVEEKSLKNYENPQDVASKLGDKLDFGDKSKDPLALEEHKTQKKKKLKKKSQSNLKCDLCSTVVASEDGMKKHMKNVHEGNICTYCGKSFTQRINLISHMKRIHEGGSVFNCNLCQKTFKNKQNLKIHKQIVHGEGEQESHVCQHCGKTFPLAVYLEKHIRNLHAEEPRVRDQKCDSCGKLFTTKINLKRHIRAVHDKTDQIQCNHCGKLASNNYDLKIHIKSVHEGIRDSKCESCGKLFSSKGELNKHVKRIHEGIRPVPGHHKCPSCEKVFTGPGGLKKHIKFIHEGVKVQCPICNKSLHGNLNVHIDTVHKGIKKYKCLYCSTAYGLNGDLKRHIKRCHSQEKGMI